MGADYLLPGSVLALKFMFKLFVDQSPKVVDFMKALITFPVDVTFLAFSFGAATLAYPGTGAPSAKMIIALVLGGVVCAFITTKLSRLADGALDRSRPWRSFAFTVAGYFIALTVVYFSLVIGTVA